MWGGGLPAELLGTEWEAPRTALAGVFLAQVGGILQVYPLRYTGVSPCGHLCHFPDI